ncbi:MAG: HAMP domain-containing protein [Verrucomicrobia bacterium]|nr:HAMP domain-containing protein [Verrucomicrobiota bacterium]
MLTKSIRWRLQVWHALLLLIVLTAFGYAAYQLTFENRMRQVDQALQQRAAALQGALMRGPFQGERPPMMPKNWPPERFPPMNTNEPGRRPFGERPPDDRFGPRRQDFNRPGPPPGEFRSPEEGGGGARGFRGGPPPMEFHLPEDLAELFGDKEGFYFCIWGPDEKVAAKSTNAPAVLAPPRLAPNAFTPEIRTRDQWRECLLQTRRAARIVVGRDIQSDLADMRRLGEWLVLCGAAVLALGLAGGWWVAHRAIRPIADISAAAREIAAGKLDRRVSVAETDNELGQLAEVLNNTFDRLQSAFARQAQFTADAAHELRTPIAVLISEAQTALARERAPGEYREAVEECLAVAQQMRRLTESLLDLSRFDSGQETLAKEPVDLAAIASDSAALVRPLAEQRGVKLVCETQPAPCLGDAQRLGQVANNLLTNAICYNRDGGEVRVKTFVEGSSAVLEVSDTGQGIAAGDLPHIFERFYRADKARTRVAGHAGLGLAIVKAILDAHSGSISVASEPGKGSTFTARLPQGK